MTLPAESFWSEIKAYEERLKKEPASYCFAHLAEIYLKAGLLEDALSVSRAGAIRYPGFVAGAMALARVCHQKGLVDECRRALEVVTGAVPEQAEAQKMLARLYAESGRVQDAGHTLQTLLEFCPDDMSAQLELESLQRKHGFDPSDDDLELIEFTDADIYEEYEPEEAEPEQKKVAQEDLLVERVKQKALFVEDPWAGAVTESAAEPGTELESAQSTPDLDAVWSMPEQQLAAAVKPEEEDPLTTPTMAELYVSQGFPEKAIAIYRRIVAADASNQDAVDRLAQLEQPPVAAEAVQAAVAAADQPPAQSLLPVQGTADQRTKLTVLEGWLENIRRLRVCR